MYSALEGVQGRVGALGGICMGSKVSQFSWARTSFGLAGSGPSIPVDIDTPCLAFSLIFWL